MCRDNAEIPGRHRLDILFQKAYNKMVADTKQEIRDSNSKVSLAVDVWSHGDKSFLRVMGYFIDQMYDFNERLLDMEPLRGNYIGVKLAASLAEVLQRYDIEDSVFAITTDNASNNETMQTALEEILLNQYGRVWDHSAMTVPCMAYVINFAALDILKYLKVEAEDDRVDPEWDDVILEQIVEKVSFMNIFKKASRRYFPALS